MDSGFNDLASLRAYVRELEAMRDDLAEKLKQKSAIIVHLQRQWREEQTTLRDEFAKAALSGMGCLTLSQANCADPARTFREAAQNAYLYADAMRAARLIVVEEKH